MHASEQFHYRGAISRGIYFLAEAAHCCKVVLWFLSRYCAIWLTDRYTSTMVERLSLCVVIGSSPTPKNHLQIVAKEGSFFGVYLRSFPTLIFHKDGSRQTTWGGRGEGTNSLPNGTYFTERFSTSKAPVTSPRNSILPTTETPMLYCKPE